MNKRKVDKPRKGGVIAGTDYARFLSTLKSRIQTARVSAARAVNRDRILLYWDIGRAIVEKQELFNWGDSVVEMVAKDLRGEFPAMTGFSPRNVWDMKRFYLTYADEAIWRQLVAKLNEVIE